MDALKVFLSDDAPANRGEPWLDSEEGIELVGTANTPIETMDGVRRLRPHVVLLNMRGQAAADTLLLLRMAGAPPFLLALEEAGEALPETVRRGADYVLSKARFGNEWRRGTADALRAFDGQARRKWEQSARQYELDDARRRRIGEELDKVGVSRRNTRARRYLTEAIRLLIDGEPLHLYYVLAQICGHKGDSAADVARAMERAIDRAWHSVFTDQEALAACYHGKVNPYKGSPEVADFIHYYAEKLKQEEQ